MIETELIGTWSLVSAERRQSDGTLIFPFGQDAIGRLMYDPKGHMFATLARKERPKFISGDPLKGTESEYREAFQGILSYWGTYEVDTKEKTICHNVEFCSLPNLEGMEMVRKFKIDNRRLELWHDPVIIKGQDVTGSGYIVWERAQTSTANIA